MLQHRLLKRSETRPLSWHFIERYHRCLIQFFKSSYDIDAKILRQYQGVICDS